MSAKKEATKSKEKDHVIPQEPRTLGQLEIASLIEGCIRYRDSIDQPRPSEVFAAAEHARRLRELLDKDLNRAQVFLNENPVNLLTLIGLLAMERGRESFFREELYESIDRNKKQINGMLLAHNKHRNDPRQSEKAFIKECWENWQNNKDEYASKAAFARDMLEKVEKLTSAKKIEDWCREWEREVQ